MKQALAIVVSLLVLGISALLVRTARFTSKQVAVEPAGYVALDEPGAAQRLARALWFRTISHDDRAAFERGEFLGFHTFLETAFPAIALNLRRELVGGLSLLYTWRGADPAAPAILLAAHMDVVPVAPGTESDWTYPPFEGRVAEGHVWGRGALDDKSGLMAIMEAVEGLLTDGFAPQRTIYLAFGHDEEVGGRDGALEIATVLQSRGARLEYVLDEGGAIVEGALPRLEAPVAIVNVAEKGYLSVELVATAAGGHSSMPPARTAVGILGAAVARLEASPMPRAITAPTAAMLEYVGPEMALLPRVVFANRWLFDWLIVRQLGATPEGNALLRTTTAPTIFAAGVQDNVLPATARAVVNFRLLPGDDTATVLSHVRRTIGDAAIAVRPVGFAADPVAASSVETPAFATIQRVVRQLHPDAIVAPGLLVGATDSRHYRSLAADVYRFGAARLHREDLDRFHGVDERIRVESYAGMVRFYRRLIRASAGTGLTPDPGVPATDSP